MTKKIVFTDHAAFKLKLLKEHGFTITKKMVRNTILGPDFTTEAKYGRKAAHKDLYGGLVMVVRRGRYERDKI